MSGGGFPGVQIPEQLHMLLSVKSFNVFVCLCIYVSICVSSMGACVCSCATSAGEQTNVIIVFLCISRAVTAGYGSSIGGGKKSNKESI